jgi:hypothetical protein
MAIFIFAPNIKVFFFLPYFFIFTGTGNFRGGEYVQELYNKLARIRYELYEVGVEQNN